MIDVEVNGKKFKHYVAERIHLCATQHISKEMLYRTNYDVAMATFGDYLICTMDTYMHGILDHEISVHEKYPADWWQALRERWFPAWWLTRYPVKYKRIDIRQKIYKAVCPHVDAPHRKHLDWMAKADEPKIDYWSGGW